MAGIYIHIPFCKKACHYCNFHFSTSFSLREAFVAALLHEITLVSGSSPAQNAYLALNGEQIETIYFGGGTPSLLHAAELDAILTKIRSSYPVSPQAEITLEANPDDISACKLAEWKRSGINRLSIGVQSFLDAELQWMNRAHTAAQSLRALEASREAGFNNITIDLIYGTPGLSNEQWEQTITTAIELNVPHLSCYALTVEPATALNRLIEKGKSPDVDPEKQATHFQMLVNRLEEAGYEHYEISNFAKKGMRSRHNSSYWQGSHYVGLGPSAHSFNGVSRQWNVANNALYISSLQKGMLPAEVELLTPTQQLNEYIMTSLRTVEGLDLIHIDQRFGQQAVKHIHDAMQKYQRSGKIAVDQARLQLTREGKLFADGIAADLFVV
ncbi:MAG: radical SAM family heme chaperone HemW [Williamsia sp.]|nr:radical SAM family heme chaperone HemW [Williamsia sp.]